MSGGFDALGLMPEVLQAIEELGWRLPTDIQDEAIPLILGGGDVMAAAETGSGKTAAFCLPIIQCVHERLKTSLFDDTSSSTLKSNLVVRLNSNDRDAELELDEVGLSCISNAPGVWAGARATYGVKGSGSYFYEATMIGTGINRVGWSTMSAHLEVGKDAHGFGYGGKGFTSYNGAYDKYGEEYSAGDVIGCYINIDTRVVSYSKNGKMLGKAYDIPETMMGTVLFPAVLVQNSSMSVNFGKTPFRFPPANGFIPLYAANAKNLFDSNSKEAYMIAGKRKPLAIIIEPTRDLAEQVYQTIHDLTKYVRDPEIIQVLLIGDDPKGKHEKKLESGVDIVVATMGKVQALIKSKVLDLSQVRFFVLDEADKLLNQDNVSSVMQIFSHCPGGGSGQHRLQVCFFSATLHSPQIRELADRICINPTWVDLKGFESVPETVHHVVYRVDPDRDLYFKDSGVHAAITDEVHLSEEFSKGDKKHPNKSLQSQQIKEIKPQILVKLIDKFQMSQCLVFCRTNVDCTNLETFFNLYGGGKKFSGAMERGKENPYSCCVLAGLRSMDERRRNLQSFKDGDVRILICTDVASRGIDIEGLPYVINMTLPDESEDYIHRVGRVGRADRMGLAISIVAGNGIEEKVWYHTCSNKGKGCANRQLKEQGGCTIWMDEPLQLAKVEKRLHMPIAVMEMDLELPIELASQNIKYGQDTKVVEIEVSPHFMQLGSTVRELAAIEMMAQNNFLSLQTKFL